MTDFEDALAELVRAALSLGGDAEMPVSVQQRVEELMQAVEEANGWG